MSDRPPPGYVRARTWEEMTSAEREFHTPRRRRDDGLPKCQGTEYDVLASYDDQVPSCHREKL
jgi:hypothetical protein